MKKQGLFRGVAAAWLLAAALLAGCGAQPEADAETTAQTVLEAVYSCEAGDSASFETALAESVTDEASLNEYWTQRLGAHFTEEGLNTLTANRVPTRVLTTWPDTAVVVESVALEEAYSNTDTQANYTYTVTASPEGITPVTFTGEIGLTLTDDGWQVSRME